MIYELIPKWAQERPISDPSYCADIFTKISDETVQKIRRIYLYQTDKSQITLKEEDITQSSQQSIEETRDRYSDRSELFDRAQEVFQRIFKPEKSFSPAELDNWANRTQTATIMQFEKETGVKTVPIPQEEQSHSCYRYALSQIGIKPHMGGLSKSGLSRTLLNHCQPVQQPRSGDLVLFFDGNSMSHLGVYQAGQILSKEGDYTPVAYLRSLQDMPAEYGKKVIYFRPIQNNSP